MLKLDALRHISVVDTPGTNSVVKIHEIVTREYLPKADLVLYVFSAADGPYRDSQWEFLAQILEWQRHVVFMLQKKDLISRETLRKYEDDVRAEARKRGISNPVVFSVSAKQEKEGSSESGFQEFCGFVRQAVENGEVARAKFEGTRDTAKNAVGKAVDSLCKQEAAVADDLAFYKRLSEAVAVRRKRADELQGLLIESVLRAYDHLIFELKSEFKAGLEVGTLIRRSIPVLRDQTVEEWIKNLEQKFRTKVEQQFASDAERLAGQIESEVKSTVEYLKSEIQGRKPRPTNPDPFAEEVCARLTKFEISKLFEAEKSLGGITAALQGSTGLGVLGIVLLASTHLVFLDITGGVLTAAATALAAGALFLKRAPIIKDFERRIDNSRKDVREQCAQKISNIFETVFLKLRSPISEAAQSLEADVNKITDLIARGRGICKRIDSLNS